MNVYFKFKAKAGINSTDTIYDSLPKFQNDSIVFAEKFKALYIVCYPHSDGKIEYMGTTENETKELEVYNGSVF